MLDPVLYLALFLGLGGVFVLIEILLENINLITFPIKRVCLMTDSPLTSEQINDAER